MADETTPTGLGKLDPEQTQNSMDMLSLALAQSSRDPGLLAQVQLQIQQRQKQLALETITAMKEQSAMTQEALKQQGATQRTATSAQAQLQSTQLAAESRERVATMEERGRTARTVFEQEQESERARLDRVQKAQTRSFESVKIADQILQDAQNTYRQMISGGSQGSDMLQMISAMQGPQMAPILAKVKKPEDIEKLSAQERVQYQQYQVLQSQVGGGKIDPAQARDYVDRMVNTRLATLEAGAPEAAALVRAGWEAYKVNFGLVEQAAAGAQIPAEKVGEVTKNIVSRLFTPEAEAPDQLLMMQTALGNIARQYPDDPQAQEDILNGIMLSVAERVEPDDPDAVEHYMQLLDGILQDGVSTDEWQDLGGILEDMGVPGFTEPGITESRPRWWEGPETPEPRMEEFGRMMGPPVGEFLTRQEERRARSSKAQKPRRYSLFNPPPPVIPPVDTTAVRVIRNRNLRKQRGGE